MLGLQLLSQRGVIHSVIVLFDGAVRITTLYHGGGAQIVTVGDSAPHDRWDKLRDIALRMLRTRGSQQAAQLLQNTLSAEMERRSAQGRRSRAWIGT